MTGWAAQTQNGGDAAHESDSVIGDTQVDEYLKQLLSQSIYGLSRSAVMVQLVFHQESVLYNRNNCVRFDTTIKYRDEELN